MRRPICGSLDLDLVENFDLVESFDFVENFAVTNFSTKPVLHCNYA